MKWIQCFITAVLVLVPLSADASAKPKASKNSRVRILSWWGYIDPQEKSIQSIQKKCKTTFSVDEFYSTTEFLDRLERNKDAEKGYDILIYSDTAYNARESQIARKSKEKLNRKIDSYAAPISAFYRKKQYNQATGIFQISLSGFLINKTLVRLNGSESLSSIFRLAGDNVAVFMDDHMEIATLLNKWECTEMGADCRKNSQLTFPSEAKLKKLVGQSKVAISSDLADITKHPKFALAYTWSGDALQKTSTQPHLEFILHPSLSHSSMDLITLVGESSEAKCVANELASREFVDAVAQKSKYFSPYGPVSSNAKAFNQLQNEFFNQFSTLGRIHRVTQQESLEIDKKWQLFKILFGSKI
jgi:spermidine/putrescine-binding protein